MRSECENKCSIFEEHRRWKPNLCREGPPKVLRDKNGKRCHPLNPFKYVIQIKKRQSKSILEGMGEDDVSEGRGRKGFPKDKKKQV